MRSAPLLFGLGLMGIVSSGFAGVYLRSSESAFDPGIVVFPTTYTGTGGPITIGVCLTPTAQEIAADVQYAISSLNELDPRQRNCSGACTAPGSAAPQPPYQSTAHSTVMHELAHCALGLDHVNRVVGDTHQNFTATKDATAMNDGADNIAGSKDDSPIPFPGSRVLHWFRIGDNDPIVIDSTAINRNTYSRNFNLLPAGSSWPASANELVGNLLGAAKTQALMVSVTSLNSAYVYLAADDANTVRLAMNGLDADPGVPSDDFSYAIVLQPDCSTAHIEIDFVAIGAGTIGDCDAQITPIPGPIPNRYRIIPSGGNPRLKVRINTSAEVSTNPPSPIYVLRLLLIDGFEAGTTGAWSSVSP